MKEVIGLCELCHEKKRLCRSHIYPESFYKMGVYTGKKNKFVTLSTDTQTPIHLEQLGVNENLMCFDCDSRIIGRYDQFIAEWLKDIPKRQPVEFRFSRGYKCVDNTLMRLFQLSLLWRFHVANGQEYDAVDLGEHADTIRQMLLKGNPGDPSYFPCVMVVPKNLSEVLKGGILCPVPTGTAQYPVCRTIAAGLVWMWLMLPNASSYPLFDFAVSQDGYLHLVDGTDELSELIICELAELNRASRKQPNAEKLSKWGFAH